MRWIILCICVCMSAADTLEVSAKTFQSDLKKGLTQLSGEVLVVKGEDKLWADKVVIETNKKNKPQKYTAIGNVRFYAKMPDKEMRGKASKAVYNVIKDEYQLIDNAVIEEIGKKNIIRGNIIILNPQAQEAFVKGSSQKPGMMTFIVEEKK
ncbi:lipopolysaccharide transport periplasmic protein LptA [Helicobacter sp. MIT 21-1697]|uniref:lipopolysaccharide transport periplasmic protein LptA n=1 Tax=Helicobacter sp. MIT 21-1697 TaxID=2993733 RepID=UPI00224B608C|nr:lipopolysaccharide transport periplasmic protein LptA [Helicobacter sp. MIT 21-1697]MCX2717221.1 lipopolysaccharide transport periplasmic protein LptA [Helicobacter sp. MIT 21-1697]